MREQDRIVMDFLVVSMKRVMETYERTIREYEELHVMIDSYQKVMQHNFSCQIAKENGISKDFACRITDQDDIDHIDVDDNDK